MARLIDANNNDDDDDEDDDENNDGEEKLDNNHQQQHEHLRLFDHFRLDPNTGELCLKKQLDYESIRVFDLPVMATDRGK